MNESYESENKYYKNEFSIIYNQPTSKLEMISDPKQWAIDNKEYLDRFINYMLSIPTAIGLASNQVFHNNQRVKDRFFIYKTDIDKKHFENVEVLINPQIIEKFGNPVEEHEGCLSWPNKTILAKRYMKIKVSYYNRNGEYIEKIIENRYQAQVWQHEVDHLDGIKEMIVGEVYKRIEEKVGRNDPCPCGAKDDNGNVKKYKKCCGK